MLAVADRETSNILTGNGRCVGAGAGPVAIGSGGPYAQSAGARVIGKLPTWRAAEIVAAFAVDCCRLVIYTQSKNQVIRVLE